MVRARLSATWEAKLRTPRVSIAFKVIADGSSLVILYSIETGVVTEAYRGDKVRRVVRKQEHLRDVAVSALAAIAMGVKPVFEIDL